MISVGHGLTKMVSLEIFQVCRLFLVPITKEILVLLLTTTTAPQLHPSQSARPADFVRNPLVPLHPALRYELLSLHAGTQLIPLPPVLPLLVLHRKSSPSLLPLIFYRGSTLLSWESIEHFNVFALADLAPPAFLKQLPPWDTFLPSLVLTLLAQSLLYDLAQFTPSNSPFLQPSLGLGLPCCSSHSSGLASVMSLSTLYCDLLQVHLICMLPGTGSHSFLFCKR